MSLFADAAKADITADPWFDTRLSVLFLVAVVAAVVVAADRFAQSQTARDIKVTERQARAGLVFVPGSLTVATDTVSVEPEPVEPVEPAAAVVPPQSAPYRAKHRGQGEPTDETLVIARVSVLHTNAGRVVGVARKPLNMAGIETRTDGSVRA